MPKTDQIWKNYKKRIIHLFRFRIEIIKLLVERIEWGLETLKEVASQCLASYFIEGPKFLEVSLSLNMRFRILHYLYLRLET